MNAYPAVGSQFGQYRITGLLGQGGMGVVLSAVHERLGRKVAIKVLSVELASRADFRRRFEREASVLAKLYSPHIIDVYDHGELDGWLFIVTQLVTGRDLDDWLAHHGPMPARQALWVTAQVASALSDAHDAGIIHRDVKPSNVLLRESTDDIFAYVCDFGISHDDGTERTRTSGLIGTYGYTAPERHEGAPATVASDIYALGCVLHAALTGRPPYQGTDVQVAMQHLHGELPTSAGPGPTSAAIDRIYRLSLAKDPAHRYPTANAMRSDLLAALRGVTGTGDQPVQVMDAAAVPTLPPSPPPGGTTRRSADEPAGRPRASRRRALPAAGVAGTVLVVGAALLLGPELFSRVTACPDGTSAVADECLESVEAADQSGDVTCWTGAPAERPADCSRPVGVKGLRWAFPSLERDFASCYRQFDTTDDPETDASVRTWFCPVPGSRTEGIGYTEWTAADAAKARFDQLFGREPTPFVVDGQAIGYRWDRPEPNSKGFYKLTSLYRRLPFSATVWAESPRGVARVCTALTARSMRTFAAEPVECGPLHGDQDTAGPRLS